MVRLSACPFVLVLATEAIAAPPEMALGDLQLQLDPRRDLIDDVSTDPYLRFAAFAQLTGGGRSGGDAGAGAAAAIGGIGCDVLAGTAHGRFRPFDGEATGEVTYSICPLKALFTIAFDGRRGTGLEPALDARRSLWARRYDDVYDRATIGFGEIWDHPARRHSIFIMSLGHGTTTQSDGYEARTIKTLDLDFFLYRYRYLGVPRVEVEAIVLESSALKAGTDNKGGVAMAFLPARVRYDDGEHFIAVKAGWGFSGGSVTAGGETKVNGETTSSWSETVDSEGLPNMTILVGDVEAGVRGDRFEATAKLSRAFYPTFDGNLAREARLAGAVSYLAGRTRRTKLSLSPFAAATRTWTRDTGSSKDHSAGASLYFGRELTKQLRIDAIGQAGVSPYARLDVEGDRLPSKTLGGQVLVALSGRVSDLQR